MPTQIQLRRGTYAQHQNFTGAVAEPTFDTTDVVLRIHDGSTPGGMEMVMGNTIYKGTPVKVVATTNLTLYGTQTVDGVALSVGDRVLVTNQTTAYSNGIYNVSLTGWTRSFDNDKAYNLNQHQFIYVTSGSVNAQTVWRQTSAAPATIGVDSITYELWLSVETRGLAQNTVSGIVTRTSKGNYTGRQITVSGQGISITNPDGVSGNPLVSLNSTPNNTASTIMARDSSGNFTAQNATLNGTLEVDTGTVTTNGTTVTLFNTSATTVNAFGNASTINIGAGTGTLTINNANTVIQGNLTVNGTTETVNSTTMVVADKNIELGKVATPTDTTATGGGVLLYGTTNKTFQWVSPNWVSSEGIQIQNGAGLSTNQTIFPLVNTNATTVNFAGAASTLNIGATSGTVTIANPTIVGSLTTQNLWNTVATTVNAFGAATSLTIGATTGTATLRNATIAITNNATVGGTLGVTGATTLSSTLGVTGAATLSSTLGVTGAASFSSTVTATGDVAANSGNITTSATTGNLFNSTATTLNIGSAATTLNIGATSGIATIANPTLVGTQTTQNVYNTVATTVNAFGAATTLNIGANSGTLTVGNPTVVGTQTTQNLWNTVATTVNAFNAATTLNLGTAGTSVALGANSGTLTVGNPTVVGTQTTQNLWNTVATTLNIGGSATAINLGNATSATLTVRPGTIVGSNTTQNLFNTVATTLNIGGAATLVSIGAGTGTTLVNNNLTVTGNLTINGSTEYIQGTNTVYTDNLLEIHAPTGGVGGTWTSSDGNDIGIRMHYYNAGDKNAALVLAQDTLDLEWYISGTESAGVFTGTYGQIKAAGLTGVGASSLNSLTVGTTLGVTGATTLSSTLAVTGAATLSSTLGVTGNTTIGGTLGVTGSSTLAALSATNVSFSGTLGVTGTTTLGTLNSGTTYASSLTLGAALPIASGGTGGTTAQAARTNLLPAQSSGQNGYVLTTNGTDVYWNYLGNAMVTSFNGRTNAVTLTSGDVTGALGFTPLSSTSGTAISAGYLTGKDAYTNGTDGWFRSNGNAGWYSATYAVGLYATQSGWVQTYNSAGVLANAFQIVSDSRLKDNIVDSKYGLDTVLQLRSVEYDKKADGKHDVGLVAQEVEQIIPEFVHEDADGMKSVNYPQMVSVLIKAVQELSAEVNALKAKLGE